MSELGAEWDRLRQTLDANDTEIKRQEELLAQLRKKREEVAANLAKVNQEIGGHSRPRFNPTLPEDPASSRPPQTSTEPGHLTPMKYEDNGQAEMVRKLGYVEDRLKALETPEPIFHDGRARRYSHSFSRPGRTRAKTALSDCPSRIYGH